MNRMNNNNLLIKIALALSVCFTLELPLSIWHITAFRTPSTNTGVVRCTVDTYNNNNSNNRRRQGRQSYIIRNNDVEDSTTSRHSSNQCGGTDPIESTETCRKTQYNNNKNVLTHIGRIRGGDTGLRLSAITSSELEDADAHHDPIGTVPLLPDTSVRGGAVSLSKSQIKKIGILIVLVLVGTSLYNSRASWIHWMDKTYIQERTLETLSSLQPSDPTDNVAWIKAMGIYMTGMACWEILGMSTIPVETAAGMVFGFWKGAIASICGKMIGASIAFTAGRTILSTWVTQSSILQNNSVFQLLNQNTYDKSIPSAQRKGQTPLQTAFLMKFSCFPESIKNFGSSVLPVIEPWMFVTVTFFHGGLFSLLWTWLGVDAAARLADTTLPVNRKLQLALILAGFIGLVLTPAVMAWWINDLKQTAASTKDTNSSKTKRFQKAK